MVTLWPHSLWGLFSSCLLEDTYFQLPQNPEVVSASSLCCPCLGPEVAELDGELALKMLPLRCSMAYHSPDCQGKSLLFCCFWIIVPLALHSNRLNHSLDLAPGAHKSVLMLRKTSMAAFLVLLITYNVTFMFTPPCNCNREDEALRTDKSLFRGIEHLELPLILGGQ